MNIMNQTFIIYTQARNKMYICNLSEYYSNTYRERTLQGQNLHQSSLNTVEKYFFYS